MNAASLLAGIAPGALVYIEGEYLAPPAQSVEYSQAGLYPTVAGDTTVTFNGVAAPLLSLSPARIAAVVPTVAAVAGQGAATEVVVSRYGVSSPPFSVAVAGVTPALFAVVPSGSTQGAPLTYPLYRPISDANPAEPGGAIILFGTGFGLWSDGGGMVMGEAAAIGLGPRNFTAKPVSLRIGGLPARLIYAGAAPYQSVGMLQINAFVPQGLASGPQPVVLTVGDADNAGQLFTIPVK